VYALYKPIKVDVKLAKSSSRDPARVFWDSHTKTDSTDTTNASNTAGIINEITTTIATTLTTTTTTTTDTTIASDTSTDTTTSILNSDSREDLNITGDAPASNAARDVRAFTANATNFQGFLDELPQVN
jgi:hypothetical protein